MIVMHISVGLRLKYQKTDCSNPSHDLNPIKIRFGGLVSSCFYDAADKPAVIAQQNSSLGSVQKTDVLTRTSGPQRRHVLAEVSGHV